ncbi:MAG TPA: SDR family oxidoreductase [Longimicrobiaceae bacterium]|nr:SDR family oxidoreductase [Longimicrobiaceae bacterium]
MRILITGGAGLLGSELIARAPAGAELHATRRVRPVAGAEAHTVELSDAAATAALLQRVRPDLVIHTAYSQYEAERDVWLATESLVHACAGAGCALIHLSSDVVFDGEHAPYAEDAEPTPLHAYGQFKAMAERLVRERLPSAAIVRTSLIVRPSPLDAVSTWVVTGLRGGDPVRLFVDELRCPIAVEDLAAQLWELAALPANARAGFWHLAGPESVSRYTLGVLVARHHGTHPDDIVPTRSRGAGLQRPRDLRLLTTRADRELRSRPRPISEVLAAPQD